MESRTTLTQRKVPTQNVPGPTILTLFGLNYWLDDRVRFSAGQEFLFTAMPTPALGPFNLISTADRVTFLGG
jgi:hypothetical protein